jgi:cysteine desulfurase
LTIYLDNMAATPIDPRVADHHCAAMRDLGANPHSLEHKAGLDAQAALNRAASSVLRTLGSEADDVTFSPGASSALWLAVEDAISRASRRAARIVATAVEHPSLLAALRRAERQGRISLELVPVDVTAAPRLEALEKVLASGVDMVCTMAANNEVGTVTDLPAVSSLAARYGARHLVDASQAAGRIDMMEAMLADLVVVSGTKIYGPRRTGALIGSITPQAAQLAHEVFGSPDAPSAIALAYALDLRSVEGPADEQRIAAMRDRLQTRLVEVVPDLVVNGDSSARLAGNLHVSTPHRSGEAAVSSVWGRVAISTGAACQSGVPGPSHVLSALDVPDWVRSGAVRIGVGRFNTDSEIDEAAELIAEALMAVVPARKRA